jgi:hypothetical protein
MVFPGFPGRSGFPVVLASVSDPDSIRSVDPYPDPDPRRQKIIHKMEKNINFMFLFAGCSLLSTEGFFCSLYVLYEGLGIGNWQLFFQL